MLISINGVWLNPSQITWLEDRGDKSCIVHFAGGEWTIIPRLNHEQVAEIIRCLTRKTADG